MLHCKPNPLTSLVYSPPYTHKHLYGYIDSTQSTVRRSTLRPSGLVRSAYDFKSLSHGLCAIFSFGPRSKPTRLNQTVAGNESQFNLSASNQFRPDGTPNSIPPYYDWGFAIPEESSFELNFLLHTMYKYTYVCSLLIKQIIYINYGNTLLQDICVTNLKNIIVEWNINIFFKTNSIFVLQIIKCLYFGSKFFTYRCYSKTYIKVKKSK